MPSVFNCLFASALVITMVPPCRGQVTQDAITPERFSARGLVLPARSIGDSLIRAQASLAIEIQVQITDYIPRGLEPTLVVDTIAVTGGSGIVSVDGRITTLGFLVDDPALLRNGATIRLRIGDDRTNTIRVPGVLLFQDIDPPDPEELRRLGLPTFQEWLMAARS